MNHTINTELRPCKRKNPAPQRDDEESTPKAKRVDPQEKLKLLQRQVELLERENAKLNSKNTKLQQKLAASNANLKRVYTLCGKHTTAKWFIQNQKKRYISIGRWKNKAKVERSKRRKLEQQCSKFKVQKNEVEVAKKTLSTTLKRMKDQAKEARFLENKVEELKETAEEETRKINTRSDGTRINPKLKEASMYLQSLGLAEHKCSEAIKLIVETMREEEIEGPLPSRTSQGRIASEMKALAMQRVAEATSGQKHMTLKYDGTTDRRGRHISEVEVATNTENSSNWNETPAIWDCSRVC